MGYLFSFFDGINCNTKVFFLILMVSSFIYFYFGVYATSDAFTSPPDGTFEILQTRFLLSVPAALGHALISLCPDGCVVIFLLASNLPPSVILDTNPSCSSELQF